MSKRKSDDATSPTRPEPGEYEQKWVERWIKSGCFSAHPDEAPERFAIVIPPPNITGSLHMGHALDLAIQDVLVRYRRLRGADALWVPGTDHAGIATQNVVERQLADEGTSRHELGREKFEERAWRWKEEAQGRIRNQLRRLGCAVDWNMERFTLDEQCSLAVRTAFKQLFDEGLIYQDTRIINWCPRCKTALSDIEVEYQEEEGGLYTILYPVEGGGGSIPVATTRPETMLGDSGVAVHPDDPRYKKFHGGNVVLPLVERVIPVITDDYVDLEFGTGALKITPAHDPNDFEIGRKHELQSYRMMDEEARITGDYPAYAGMDRDEARAKIVEDLDAKGLLAKKEAYKHSVGHCYRCQCTIEPYLSLQWFVKIAEIAKAAADAVREERTKFVPERWTKVYLNWLDNIRDWCISRQLWWGHRIPVWTCGGCGRQSSSIGDLEKCPACSSADLKMEEDVLDTWFSSGLWPLSTLGWPKETKEMKMYYPTSVLVTGFDIIFFWVARMMMFGVKFGGDVPFRDVYIHGIVRDSAGKKMSKSYGNVVDPLEVIEKYGADAMRFSFFSTGGAGQDIYVSEEKFIGGRNLLNKLWNSARFILMTAPGSPPSLESALKAAAPDLAERWILSRLRTLLDEAAELMDAYRIEEAAQKVYAFFWHDFCDWYLEIAKNRWNEAGDAEKGLIASILHNVYAACLTLFNPFIPFITEEIWERLPSTEGMLADAALPAIPFEADGKSVKEMEFIQEFIRNVRDIRVSLNVKPSAKIEVFAAAEDSERMRVIKNGERYIFSLSGVSRVVFNSAKKEGAQGLTALVKGVEIFVSVPEEIAEAERERLDKKRKKLVSEMEKIELKLHNESFLERAPAEVVRKERGRFAELQEDFQKLSERMKAVNGKGNGAS